MAYKRFDSKFKAKVTLEAIQRDKTVVSYHHNTVCMQTRSTTGRNRRGEHVVDIFERGGDWPSAKKSEAHGDRLYRQIGKLQVEVDWLRKSPRRWAYCERETRID